MPTIIDFVRLGYGDMQRPPLPVRALEFLTDELTNWIDVEACLQVIGAYNLFDPDRVAAALEPHFGDAMHVRIGREGSPVIIVDIPYFTSQAIATFDTTGRRIPEAERNRLAEQVADALARVGGVCDIVDWKSGDDVQVGYVRAWWD